MTEFLSGGALDQLEYYRYKKDPPWKPTDTELIKIALDIAKGLDYMHFNFMDEKKRDWPIIHRDLKPANVLLVEKPPKEDTAEREAWQPWCKIADFGLARAKRQIFKIDNSVEKINEDIMKKEESTAVDSDHDGRPKRAPKEELKPTVKRMESCGSPIYQAPEIMWRTEMGAPIYDESVDIYSFAMCMLELRSSLHPWVELPTTHDPVKRGWEPTVSSRFWSGVIDKQRPTWLLRKGGDGREKKCDFMNALIKYCWRHDPAERPDARQLMQLLDNAYKALRMGQEIEPLMSTGGVKVADPGQYQVGDKIEVRSGESGWSKKEVYGIQDNGYLVIQMTHRLGSTIETFSYFDPNDRNFVRPAVMKRGWLWKWGLPLKEGLSKETIEDCQQIIENKAEGTNLVLKVKTEWEKRLKEKEQGSGRYEVGDFIKVKGRRSPGKQESALDTWYDGIVDNVYQDGSINVQFYVLSTQINSRSPWAGQRGWWEKKIDYKDLKDLKEKNIAKPIDIEVV